MLMSRIDIVLAGWWRVILNDVRTMRMSILVLVVSRKNCCILACLQELLEVLLVQAVHPVALLLLPSKHGRQPHVNLHLLWWQ